MKKGYYYINTDLFERCYYLSGEKKGNKWIDIRYHKTTLNDAEWMALNWMCLPDKEELKDAIFHELNPTKYKLN